MGGTSSDGDWASAPHGQNRRTRVVPARRSPDKQKVRLENTFREVELTTDLLRSIDFDFRFPFPNFGDGILPRIHERVTTLANGA